MTTIANELTRGIKNAAEIRLTRLIKLDAPSVIIDNVEETVNNPLKGIGGIKKFGHLEILGEPIKTKGRGGKQVVFFETIEGKMCYTQGNWGGWNVFKSNK